MKTNFITFLLAAMTLPCFAQNNVKSITAMPIFENGPTECKSCECSFNNLFNSWNEKNIVNYKDLTPVSWKLVDSLTDSTKIHEYYNKLTDKESYHLGYSGNTKRITISQGYKLTNEGDINGMKYRDGEIRKRLTLGSKIYLLKVKFKDGKTVENISVCDGVKNQITWDNLFTFLWIFYES